MSVLKEIVSTATGDVTGDAAGTVVGGNAVHMGHTSLRVTDLSALIDVTANTSGLTFTPRWQVSADNSTWYTLASPDNPAMVALATGASGGGDDNGVVALAAPSAVKGWQYARAAVVTAGATGTTNDVYSIGYSYRQHRSGSRR